MKVFNHNSYSIKFNFLILSVLFHAQCISFNNNEIKTSILDSNKNEYNVIYIPGNAVTNSAIIIRENFNPLNNETIAVFENYTDFIMFKKMANDSLSVGVWYDVGEYPGPIVTKIDTFKIHLHYNGLTMIVKR